jgi:hypothetical protein
MLWPSCDHFVTSSINSTLKMPVPFLYLSCTSSALPFKSIKCLSLFWKHGIYTPRGSWPSHRPWRYFLYSQYGIRTFGSLLILLYASQIHHTGKTAWEASHQTHITVTDNTRISVSGTTTLATSKYSSHDLSRFPYYIPSSPYQQIHSR